MSRVASIAGATALVLAGCLEAPPQGGVGSDDDAGDVVGSPDAAPPPDASVCQVEPGECLLAEAFRDTFDSDASWSRLETAGCAYDFSPEGGVSITRGDEASYCTITTIGQVDLRCSSLYVHLDSVESIGSDASLSIILGDGTYYYIEREPPDLVAGICNPSCTNFASVPYAAGQHLHFRLRATADRLIAEVGGPDEELMWTELWSFDDVLLDELDCVKVELGHYGSGVAGSTARFFDLNL